MDKETQVLVRVMGQPVQLAESTIRLETLIHIDKCVLFSVFCFCSHFSFVSSFLEFYRKWWKEHLFAVVLGAVATLVLSLSIFGIWLIWRHRQQVLGMYKPVGANVPEQELQQL
uniref:Uncharacterized protein n=1 Tax=Nelumbo nucifera TaxID=4432 RepID=A0A822Z994_NELNU|nr:TPA_asm: hypothetical protein HUJ06_015740 [Nelumbo nucifera]